MTKIKNIKILGLRGIKNDLTLPLNKKSILIYGDNGSGKSSITDAFEWFYYGKVEHLISEEIGKGGLNAVINIFREIDKKAQMKIDFTNSKLNAEKTLTDSSTGLSQEFDNLSDEFNSYINSSIKENLILRYRDLVSFVLSTKKDKLEELSKIIGFSEIVNHRNLLKKITNRLGKELRAAHFEKQISNHQSHLIENLGENIPSEEKFIESINKLLKPLELKEPVNKLEDIDNILRLIKTPTDLKQIELKSLLTRLKDFSEELSQKLKDIEDSYSLYFDQFEKITNDIEKLKQLTVEKLLSEGIKIIKGKLFDEELCPLCLLPKQQNELLSELENRIIELKEIRKEKEQLQEAKDFLVPFLSQIMTNITAFLQESYFKEKLLKDLKALFLRVGENLNKYIFQLKVDIDADKFLAEPKLLMIERNSLDEIVSLCTKLLTSLNKKHEKDNKFEAHSKIELSRRSFLEIIKLRKEKSNLENIHRSMELVFNSFIQMQKDSLEEFLNMFSEDINDLYQFMNPLEKVEDIRLIPILKNGELTGITIEFEFFNTVVSPPHKYLSESHLNCLGLAFFLSSVKAFNRNNKFFILDDVISSFDTNHRKRFCDLLIEKFGEYQVILLTHEKDWFDYSKHEVLRKGWEVKSVKWNEEKGTTIDAQPANLKDSIQDKIDNNVIDGLGNDLRQYLEDYLMKIASNIKVKVNFQFNDRNEERMGHELLSDLKNKVKKHVVDNSNIVAIIDRMLSSLFIANKGSHKGGFSPSMGDYKAVWAELVNLAKVFGCANCEEMVSLLYFDQTKKLINCKCAKKYLGWKK